MSKTPFEVGADGEIPDHLTDELYDDLQLEKPKNKAKNAPTRYSAPLAVGMLVLMAVCMIGFLVVLPTSTRSPKIYPTLQPTATVIPAGVLAEMPSCLEEPLPTDGYMVISVTFDVGASELMRADLDGDNQCRLTRNSVEDNDPTISADGQFIYYATEVRGDGIMRMRADGSDAEVVRNYGTDPTISPDGKSLIYSSALVYGSNIIYAVVDASSDSHHSLTGDDVNAPSNDVSPAWSPDGEQVVYLSDRYGDKTQGARLNLYIMNKDGSNVRRILPSEDLQMSPDWSPDGQYIVFTNFVPEEFAIQEVYIVRPDGTDLQRLTEVRGFKFSPVWGDAETIYYIGDAEGETYPNTAIYRLSLDGTIERVTGNVRAQTLDVWIAQEK